MKLRSKKTFSFSIKSRILYTFILFVVLPSVLFLIYCIRSYSEYALSSIIKEKHSIMEEIHKNISFQFSNFKDTTMTFYYNDRIRDYIDREDYEEESDYIYQYLNSIVNSEKYIASAVLDLNGSVYQVGYHYLDLESYFEKHQKTILDRKGKAVWLSTEVIPSTVNQQLKQFVLARAVNSPNGTVGILWLFFSEDFFKDILNNDSIRESAEYYMVAPDKRILTSDNPKLVGEETDIAYMDKVIEEKNGFFNHYNEELNENEIIVFSTSKETGWSVVTVSLESVVFQDLHKIEVMACIIFICYVVFLIGAYALLVKVIFRPLEQLSVGMQFVSRGDFSQKLEHQNNDEIGMLSSNYNYMVEKIQTLMQDIRLEEQEKNEERVKVLAMQIGPHFVFNTLNTIKWMASVNRQDNIRKMIESLIRLMRSVTYHTNEEISVAEEIELLQCYVYIQKTRFINFEIIFEVEEGVMSCGICKLILQPLVENAIIHAFREKVEGGKIEITIYTEKEFLMIEVKDNGKGFNPEILEEESKKEQRPDKIGLENISERIKLNYGSKYGITIKSEKEIGTKILLKLPYKKMPCLDEH